MLLHVAIILHFQKKVKLNINKHYMPNKRLTAIKMLSNKTALYVYLVQSD